MMEGIIFYTKAGVNILWNMAKTSRHLSNMSSYFLLYRSPGSFNFIYWGGQCAQLKSIHSPDSIINWSHHGNLPRKLFKEGSSGSFGPFALSFHPLTHLNHGYLSDSSVFWLKCDFENERCVPRMEQQNQGGNLGSKSRVYAKIWYTN